MEVSVFMMGCGNFGGVGSAPEFFGMGESDEEAMALLDRSLDLGITVLDTADAYGGGRSEAVIGEWLAARGSAVRDRLLISTKVGNPVGPDLDRSGLSPAHVERQVDASLRALGVDHIDLYLAHEPDPETPLDVVVEGFDAVVRSGKVRAVGISNHTAADLSACLGASAERDLHRFEWVQNSCNLIDHAGQADTLAICAEHELGFTPFGPLHGGWLTGKYDFDADYPADSRMAMRPEPYLDRWTRPVFDAIETLAAMAADHGVSPAGLALAWLVAYPGVTAAIVGPRRPAHFAPVEEALQLTVEQSALDHLTQTFVEATS